MTTKHTRHLAALLSLSLLLTAAGCSSKDTQNDSPTEPETAPVAETQPVDDSDSRTICWLADYDLNPTGSNDRSVAVTLFEDQYHGKIEWIPCTAGEKFDALASRIQSGEPVDMFPYELDTFPNGICKEQFQPLDDYLDLNDSMWDDMRPAIDLYACNGRHYVVPYDVTDPVLLTYSRRMCRDNGLDDPYTLYQNGEWNWDTFLEMMQTFTAGGSKRYGIAGWFGKVAVQSTGKTVVSFDGSQFINNIADSDIEAAENFMADIQSQKLYDSTWYNSFPSDESVLFYGMGEWALGESNANNPDADLMVVPFPKSPDGDGYYLSANYAAKMLVKNSAKGEAVAAYIQCERQAVTDPQYQSLIKEKALTKEFSGSGAVLSFCTEEQYDAIAQYKQELPTVFDFGYGMGSTMYGNGEYTYETRGIMNNLMDALLCYPESASSWETLRDSYSGAVDEVISGYNASLPNE